MAARRSLVAASRQIAVATNTRARLRELVVGESAVRVRHGDDCETVDAREVVWVAGVDRQVVDEGGRSNHRIERAGRRLPPGPAQRRRNLTEPSSGRRVEHQWDKVRLGLLQMSLAGSPLFRGPGDERSDRELGKGHDADQWLIRKRGGVDEPAQEEHGARVEQTSGRRAHIAESMRLSMSARSRAASTAGSRRRRSMSCSPDTPAGWTGRSSATARPARVTVRCSPRSTRSTTAPPWFLSSRIVTSATSQLYHA